MTRDPKRMSLVEWYQELVDRVFLNYQPPQEKQPAPPRSEEPAEKDQNKTRDTRSFYRVEGRISLDGAA